MNPIHVGKDIGHVEHEQDRDLFEMNVEKEAWLHEWREHKDEQEQLKLKPPPRSEGDHRKEEHKQ